MPAIIDPRVFSLRVGDAAFEHGDPFTGCGMIEVQRDRSVLIEAFAGEFTNRDFGDTISQLRKLGELYRWTEIVWDRTNTGSMRPIRIPIFKGATGPRHHMG